MQIPGMLAKTHLPHDLVDLEVAVGRASRQHVEQGGPEGPDVRLGRQRTSSMEDLGRPAIRVWGCGRARLE